jgi:hypothetical protein
MVDNTYPLEVGCPGAQSNWLRMGSRMVLLDSPDLVGSDERRWATQPRRWYRIPNASRSLEKQEGSVGSIEGGFEFN